MSRPTAVTVFGLSLALAALILSVLSIAMSAMGCK